MKPIFWTNERKAELENAMRAGGMEAAREAFPQCAASTLYAKSSELGILRRLREAGIPLAGGDPSWRERRRKIGATALAAGKTVSAGFAPNLLPVRPQDEKLPWVRYPRDAATLRRIADYLRNTRAVAAEGGASQEILAFFDSEIAYVSAIANRADRQAAVAV